MKVYIVVRMEMNLVVDPYTYTNTDILDVFDNLDKAVGYIENHVEHDKLINYRLNESRSGGSTRTVDNSLGGRREYTVFIKEVN